MIDLKAIEKKYGFSGLENSESAKLLAAVVYEAVLARDRLPTSPEVVTKGDVDQIFIELEEIRRLLRKQRPSGWRRWFNVKATHSETD